MAHPKAASRTVTGRYVDQVARRQQFEAAHLGISITVALAPVQRWTGVIAASDATVTSWCLGDLLDKLETLLAAPQAGSSRP